MKKLFTLLCFTVIVSVGYGQLRLAIAGGPHQSKIQESNSLPGWDDLMKPGYSGRGGFNVGVLAEIPISENKRWYIQPGIFYMTKGRKFSRTYDTAAIRTDSLSLKSEFFPNYIDIPVNITYKLPLGKKNSFFISAGPYIGFFYTGKQTTETKLFDNNSVRIKKNEMPIETGNETWKVKTIDYGVNARAGFEFGSLLISGFMSQGLNNFYTAPYDAKFNNQVMGASVGFWLNKAPLFERKPKDKDNDGVIDKDDACPLEPGTFAAGGCPDKDGDGVADKVDKCPDVAGLRKYGGCPPPDRDGDGIIDEEDKCPDVPGTIKYKGCPIPDTDKDGVNDEEDKCPTLAGSKLNNGCPLPDSDGDGIPDNEDKCPTAAGPKSNKGCPELKKELIDKVNYVAKQIFFDKASDRLTAPSMRALEEVVNIMNNNPHLVMAIDGHSDNTGNAQKNLNLSAKRANAVKQYLVQKGISHLRLDASGFGQSKPIADNNTEAGRAKNRRVELRLASDWGYIRPSAAWKASAASR
ncbi:OmpA family protein [Pseudoflavitalea sp. G-6-1-2]|uniref:OmpA family protein n=1 Tax=Pseudoflavitalea sp. G-6-1-2 TaxID=2728841 RepID=UPI00146A77FE|nr:OmpA family protein [Pseudoflavitalea sp. G-6-1-2]NML23914.1 OmpA family protein [Pseudoflavitalea sp. G-6-1-2]